MPAPHRTLRIQSARQQGGFMEGEDVKLVQMALRRYKALATLKVDGVYGPAAGSASAYYKRWIGGFPAKALRKGFASNLSPKAQRILLGLEPTPKYWLWRAAWRRRNRRLHLDATTGTTMAEKAAQWAERRRGLVEIPAGSNVVPWLVTNATSMRVAGGLARMGYAWCAFFFWLAYLHAGSVTADRVLRKVAWNGLLTNTILDLALDGKEGMRILGWSELRRGAGTLWNFPGGDSQVDHIEMALARSGERTVATVGGNTSLDDNGSQSNGGAVGFRTRNKENFVAGFTVVNPAG